MMHSWEELKAACAGCVRCGLCETRHHVVFGIGNEEASIMFVGEGPGEQEDLKGEPFVGPAGKLLDDMLSIIDLDRKENCYICNIVKCRPPRNRDPLETEQDACIEYLRGQVALVKPKIIVLLGSIALKNILGNELSITASRGKWIEKKGIYYMPTWHPAALLRDENKKMEFWRDLKVVLEKI